MMRVSTNGISLKVFHQTFWIQFACLSTVFLNDKYFEKKEGFFFRISPFETKIRSVNSDFVEKIDTEIICPERGGW